MRHFFQGFKISHFIPNLIISTAFPVVFTIGSAVNERLLNFINALTIVGLVLIIFGVVYHLYRKGDFDITQYILNRSMNKNAKPYDAYMEDKEEKRKETFNYPLLIGILFLIVSIIVAYTCF